jgi:hypothetical protein
MSAAALVFATTDAFAVDIVGFNLGSSYSILGTTNSPTAPVPLQVLLDSAVPIDTVIAVSSSNPGVLTVQSPWVTVPAGQSSAVMSFNAPTLGIAEVTASLGTSTAHAWVEVVTALPAVPEPPAAWLLAAGLAAVGTARRQARRQPAS